MIKEALEFLREKFAGGEKFQEIKGPDGSVGFYKPNGQSVATFDGYPTRTVECLSFLDLIATIHGAQASLGFGGVEADAASDSISIGSKSINANLRAGFEQYEIRYPLEMTRPAGKLAELVSEKACEHKVFIKLLRTTFRGVCDEDLHKQFAKVSFVQNVKTDSEAVRGRDSFGKSVDAALANATELPESFVVRCNLFSGLSSEIEIEVFIFIDFDSARFCLWIDSQQWANELEKVRRDVVKSLATEFQAMPILVGEITEESKEGAPRFN